MVIPVGFANFVASFSISGDAEPMQTAWGIDCGTAGGAFQPLLEYLADSLATAIVARQSVECQIGPYRLEVGQDGGDPVIYEYPATTQGTNGEFPPPPNVALLLRKATSLGGRRNRGRNFIPGVAIAQTTSAAGIVDPFEVTALQTAWTNFFEDCDNPAVDGADGLVLLHAIAPFTPTTLTGLIVQSKVATQRRRLRP